MRVLVTGGGGFIGAWIVRALAAAGHEPRIFDLGSDRRILRFIAGDALAGRTEWVSGDIADTAAVEAAAEGTDAVIHLAGLLTPACRADPVLGAKVNLIGTLNAFLAARRHGIGRVLYMSSIGVFGPEGGALPAPTTLYGAFKLGGEYAARAFHADDRIASIGFRPYVVYGPGREAGLSAGPSLAARAVARGEAYTIPFTGTVDLIHVEDVADAFLRALTVPLDGAAVVNLWGERLDAAGMLAAIRAARPDARIAAEGPSMPIEPPPADGEAVRLLPGFSSRRFANGFAASVAFLEQAEREART